MTILAIVASAVAVAGAAQPQGPNTQLAAPAICCHLTAGTVVELETTELLTSKVNKPGQTIRLRTTTPLIAGGILVIPAGTAAIGEVVDAAPAGWSGRAGKLILAARYIEFDGKQIPLRGFRFDLSGTGMNIDDGVIMFGGRAISTSLTPPTVASDVNLPAGTRANAKLAQPVDLTPAASIDAESK
jgi:hypothetical protein